MLKSGIFKVTLDISNLAKQYYHTHQLTVARHPSENDLRMMLRILLFAMHASKNLSFTKGLCLGDEPDLWQKNDNDDIESWIMLGEPSEKIIRKACAKSAMVFVYPYHTKSAVLWWQQIKIKAKRFENLHVIHLPEAETTNLVRLVKRRMFLQNVIGENELWFGNQRENFQIKPEKWK